MFTSSLMFILLMLYEIKHSLSKQFHVDVIVGIPFLSVFPAIVQLVVGG
jgi:hypothetical protein